MAAPRKKPSKKQSSASTEEQKLSKLEQIDVDHLLAQAMQRYKAEEADKKQKIKEISHLSAIAEEYLSCFALIGYSLQNEKVVVLNMLNSKDEAALVDLLRATFLEIASNRP